MHAWKCYLSTANKLWFCMAALSFLVPSGSALGQVRVSLDGEFSGKLDDVKPPPVASFLRPLPRPSTASAPSQPLVAPSVVVETRAIKLSALPGISAFDETALATPVQTAICPPDADPKTDLGVVQASSSQDSPSGSIPNRSEQDSKKPEEPPFNAEDVRKPIDAFKAFQKLELERSTYFESATVSEITRLQTWMEGPYTWSAHGYSWHSPTFCYSPLYFEQPNLERYGQGIGHPFAPATSAIAFVADVTTLPIAMVCTPPWSQSCTLGHHRPGDVAPCQRKTVNH